MKARLFLLLMLMSPCLKSQNCQNLLGDWQNELGSVLHIDTITDSGEILGVYKSSTGVDGKIFDLKGWVNSSEAHPDQVNVSFTVRWEGYGSITSWTGYCHNVNNENQIKTVWHLVRVGKEFEWERVITNFSIFKPNG